MYLYKKEGSTKYWFSFTHGKRRYQHSTKLENKKDADDYASAFRTKVVKGEVGLTPKPRFTIGELLDKLKQRWQLNKRATVQNLCLLEKTRKDFGATKMADELTGGDLERYALRMRKDDYAAASVNRRIQCLRRAFSLAGVKWPKFELLDESDNVRQGVFKPEEMTKVLSHLPNDGLRDFVEFAYNSGMRKGELSALRWAWRHGDSIVVPAGACKNKKPHRIPIAGLLAAIIKRREDARSFKSAGVTRMSEYIFHRGDGAIVGDFKKSWKTACTAAGCGNRIFHDLRRTFCSDAIDAGTPQSTVMALSGHRTISVFLRYAISSDDSKSEALEKLAKHRAG